VASPVGTVYVDVKFNIDDAAADLKRKLGGGGGAGGAGAAAKTIESSWSSSLDKIGKKAYQTGRQMTLGLTVPLVAIGKSAITSFGAFDTAMTQINSLVGVSRKQTDAWRDEVRELGRTYGVAAEDAAKALYYITSSGVEGNAAMDALKVSIEGAAVGLGSVETIADVVTSAMNAYGSANVSAAEAADILTVAVKDGKGEASELAGALSQVIPIAANLNVSFGEVAGAMSAMTLSGTSADEAATQLRGLFNTLQDMPPIAQRALKAYTGLDYETERLKLTHEGLVPVLKEIFDGFGDNKVAMAEVFGNIRALTGVMNLFGKNTDRTLKIIYEVTHASNALNDAWAETAQSKAKQLDIAMNNLHDSMIEIGSVITPMATTAAKAVGGLTSAFTALPAPIQSTVAGLGGLVAIAGPVLVAFGAMSKAMSSITREGSAFSGVATRMKDFSTRVNASSAASGGLISKVGGLGQVLGASGAAFAAAAGAVAIWSARMEEARRNAEALGNVQFAGATKGGVDDAVNQMKRVDEQIKGINKDLAESSNWAFWDADNRAELEQYATTLTKGNEATRQRVILARALSTETGNSADAAYKWLASEEKVGRTYRTTDEAMKAYAAALIKGDEAAKDFAASNDNVHTRLQRIISDAQKAADMFFGVRDAEKAVVSANKDLEDARRGITDAEDAYAAAKLKTLEADQDITKAVEKQAEATRKVTDARQALTEAQKELNDALRGPSEDEKINLESAQLALQSARKRSTGKFDNAIDRRQAQLDVRRAQLDLTRVQGEHDKRIADARKGVAAAQAGVNDALQGEVDANQGVIKARQDRTQASKDEAKAYEGIATAHDKVREAEGKLFDATATLLGKQAELNNAIAIGTFNGSAFAIYLDKIKERYPDLAGTIDDYIGKFNELEAAVNPEVAGPGAPPKSVTLGPTPGTIIADGVEYVVVPGVGVVKVEKRAYGGPLKAGQMSTVNERGAPELWSAGGKQYLLPLTPGQVVPLRPSEMGGTDGSVTVGDIYVQGAQQPVQTAYEVRRQLRAKTRQKARV
jgi:TP901 family phage tail tape measure protein